MKKITGFAIAIYALTLTSGYTEEINFNTMENSQWMQRFPGMQQEVRNRMQQNQRRQAVRRNYSSIDGSSSSNYSYLDNPHSYNTRNSANNRFVGEDANPMEELFEKYPELQEKMDAMRNLSHEERMTAMQELEQQYPELVEMRPQGGPGRPGGPNGGMNEQMQQLFNTYPELAEKMEAMKDLSHEERMSAMQELEQQYPELAEMRPQHGQGRRGGPGGGMNEQMQQLFESNPELQTKMESLRDLSHEERRTAMQELEQQYPELAEMRPQHGQGRRGGPGGGMNQQMQQLFENNPELQTKMESLRGLSHEERRTAMQELEQQYPELAEMRPQHGQGRRGGPGGGMNQQMQQLFENNPELQTKMDELRNLSREDRRSAMQSLKQEYPELENIRGKRRGFGSGSNHNSAMQESGFGSSNRQRSFGRSSSQGFGGMNRQRSEQGTAGFGGRGYGRSSEQGFGGMNRGGGRRRGGRRGGQRW
jgi:ribosomal protein L29